MIELFSLTPEIEQALNEALGGYNEYFKKEISARRCQLWEVFPGTYCITRIEVDEVNGSELVVCCYQGEKVSQFTKWLISFTREKKLNSIRFHTNIEKLGKVMEKKYKFAPVETIYRLKV